MKRVLLAGATVLATLVALLAFLPGQSATAADGVPTTWKSVNARGETTCAIDEADGLWCWGYNAYGQVGNGTTDEVLSPVRIGSQQWLSVSTSQYTTCGILLDHSAYCWGYNGYGTTGTGAAGAGLTEPTKVDSTVSWAKISTGVANTCGISTAGALYCWGYNSNGGVGDGTTTDRFSPVQVGISTDWAGIQTGFYHSCGRTKANKVSCWGFGRYGSLGNGSTDDALVPTAVAGNYAQISTSANTTCGVTVNKISKCWGSNGNGQVGDGTTNQQSSPTTLASGSKSFSSMRTGENFTCGLTSSQAKVRCVGDNAYYQFGDGTTTDSAIPTDAAGGLTDWARVSVGLYSSCGLRASGALYCWGNNSNGELGVGTTDSYSHRVRVGRTPAADPSASRKVLHPSGPTGRP